MYLNSVVGSQDEVTGWIYNMMGNRIHIKETRQLNPTGRIEINQALVTNLPRAERVVEDYAFLNINAHYIPVQRSWTRL